MTNLLKVRAGGEDLVDEILDGEDVELAERPLNDLVRGEGNALLVDLAVSALVDQLTDGLEVGLAVYNISAGSLHDLGYDAPVSDIWLNKTEHVLGGLGHLNEDTVVDLEETEELQNLAGLGRNLVDTVALSIDAPQSSVGARTPEYGQRSTPWPVQGRRSHQQHEQPVSDGSPPSPQSGTPSRTSPHA